MKISMSKYTHLNTVEPKEAARQTDAWRTYYAYEEFIVSEVTNPPPYPIIKNQPLFKDFKEDAFRGFKIPLKSLEELMEVINQYNADVPEKIGAVRMYVARTQDDPTNTNAMLHTYLVPVIGGNDDDSGHDMIMLDGSSCIFDFSTPCPKQCDVTSILYAQEDTHG